jgi:hypothetical protein
MPVYKFAPGNLPDSFIFPTDKGWFYSVSFLNKSDLFAGNHLLLNDGLSFEIMFDRSPLDHNPEKGADESVKETILAIISSHLRAKGVLPIYFFLCDMTDRQEAVRARLFTNWYETSGVPEWELYNFELTSVGDADDAISYYAGMLMHDEHPKHEALPDAFQHFLEEDVSNGKWATRR